MTLKNIVYLSGIFAVIAFITLFIFFKGRVKNANIQIVYTLFAISLKFILEAIAALIWFVIAKNVQTQYILLFFVLYLSFTLFSILIILNILKNKYINI
jgi:hypothetical protein